ncbi:hypothetical protein BDV23DRAFT_181125 [Aspergillus alliaceus]|uniref:Uncharacterized protein n=1 Tax=Petromyces alliaceus TaxID=209559 RepID=A0A5N7CFM5_PETAA|nr:uncharacterized protein BDW43DRAFT_152516 [Aspergillus alliaceus]KAB8238063.1 hypothetical protein BDW43DRAFT_152516 [Aspergillus alliaceus]KAE8392980.1 hypothetical protein BDV23DRAFT_181125 [Aspergillus alliaceus]
MPFSDHAPRLGFLKDAANSLELLSPSTAAHLMAVHNQIYFDELRPLRQRHQEASCGACGSIRKPEWTRTVHIKKKTTKRNSSLAAPDGATIYKCLRCRRRTVKPSRREPTRLNAPPKVAAATDSTPSTIPPAVQYSAPTEEKETTSKKADNANSKKRAKARKQGGLQALLASKQQSRSNSSLDLFDFLQQ